MSWTQAQCETCWNKENPTRKIHRVIGSEGEICCDCGQRTYSGIYTRKDPKQVMFPRKEYDESSPYE